MNWPKTGDAPGDKLEAMGVVMAAHSDREHFIPCGGATWSMLLVGQLPPGEECVMSSLLRFAVRPRPHEFYRLLDRLKDDYAVRSRY